MSKKKDKQSNPFDYNMKNLQYIILDIFRAHPAQSFNYKQFSKTLGAADTNSKRLIAEALETLAREGKIEEETRGKYTFIPQSSIITGTIDMTKSGSAYLLTGKPDGDIFIPQEKLNQALHGDTVEVTVWARHKKKPVGEVTKIVKRHKIDFAGIVNKKGNYAFLEVSESRMPYDIFIPEGMLGEAQHGQKAIARIMEWDSKSKNPSGKIIDVLGNPGENDTEMHAILAEFDLPYKFPEKLEELAKQIDAGISEEEIAKREDFRNVLTFTIDPHDAKDFDDALSYKILPNGNIEVGVHIADVTHYVQPGTAIDNEAVERGTSVYLVDRTVPMLPEHLSNFICSLRPNEEKLTYSAIFEMTENADIVKHRFAKTIINSARRFTYEEAQERIETGEGDLATEILHLDKLAKKLREKRFGKGAIAFDRVEVRFNIDPKGKPLSVYFKEMKDSNQLIEEFMLLANRYVAEYVGKQTKATPKTFVYRVHDEPDFQKLYDFSNFIKRFGYNIKFDTDKSVAKSINGLLSQVRGKAEQNVVEQLAVRSMAKAVYTTDNIGHYGLAFDFYTHFTSPIRRYPDMMVHRLLARYLAGGDSVSAEKFEIKCKHASDMEQRAANAERASIKYKQVEFMTDKLGSVYPAVITGVTEHGMYAEIIENKIEGMVPMRELSDDFYVYDEKNYCIIGRRKHKRYQMGDTIKIQIVRADMQKRRLDFVIAD